MTAFSLRPYQADLVQQIYRAWSQGHRRVMLQLPTGAGKSVIFRQLVEDRICQNQSALILAHRKELIDQAAAHVERAGLAHGIIKAGYPPDPLKSCQVASVASLVRRTKPHADLVVVDEAHHATAKTYQKILVEYPNAFILGFTATPCRTDGSGFVGLFDDLICGPSTAQLIREGYLSKYVLYGTDQPISTQGIKVQAGDYNLGQLESAANTTQLNGNLVRTWREKCDGKRTLVFCVTVKHSQATARAYHSGGIPAEHLDGGTPDDEREAILARFAKGETLVLCNVGIISEGFDLPAIEVVQIARPTKSLGLYLQMIGRALRLCPEIGKERTIILDHAESASTHGFPDDPRKWTLEGVEAEAGEAPVKMCPECRAIVPAAVKECPECGHVFIPKKKVVEDATNSLVQLQACSDVIRDRIARLKQIADERRYHKFWCYHELVKEYPDVTLGDLQALGDALGYKKGWAYYRLEELRGAQQV